MKNLVEYKRDLEDQIKGSLAGGWCGDLDPFAEFVNVALTKHLYDVMNDETKQKPTFEEWEELLINKDNLVHMLHKLREYQENEDFRLTDILRTA